MWGNPSLNSFVYQRLRVYLRFSPEAMCTLVRARSRRVPNQEGAGIGFAVDMLDIAWLFLVKRPRFTQLETAISLKVV
jgi:hypothetical protein